MHILVTCGPSYEPIDNVRRLTNFSSGELGVMLCEEFARAGHEVVCLKGTGATHPDPQPPVRTLKFHTNDQLQKHLEAFPRFQNFQVDVIFHVAALCDFRVAQTHDSAGNEIQSDKISSRLGTLTLTLEPALKVISGLRPLFPKARLVGWKYELVGTRNEAIQKGIKQIIENHTDACVVNGKAYGEPGAHFGFCTAAGLQHHCLSKAELCQYLVSWV